MKKIEKLTPEQIAKLPQYAAEWTAHGLCSQPAKRPEAEEAIRLMYQGAGLSVPRIIWADSPLSGALVVYLLKNLASVRDSLGGSVMDSLGGSVMDSLGDSVRASVRDSLWDSLWNSVRGSVGDSVWDSVWASVRGSVRGSVWGSVRGSFRGSVGASVRDSVWDSLGGSVRGSVWDSVWASVRGSVRGSVWASLGGSVRGSVGDSVWDSVWDSLGGSVMDSLGDSVRGQHEAHWLAFYKYFNAECGLMEETKALGGLWQLCESCGWIYPYEDICVATERPIKCAVDENGQIHAENGPAIEYPDGFKVYGWHGTRLPEEWIENKETIDPTEILRCENVELRAAGSAMVGWPRMLAHLKHEVVDHGPDSDWGDLLRVWMPDLPEPALMLKAECPRNGTICEFVPDTGRSLDGRTYPVNTVLAAQAARVFEHPETYQHPERRT